MFFIVVGAFEVAYAFFLPAGMRQLKKAHDSQNLGKKHRFSAPDEKTPVLGQKPPGWLINPPFL